jgi:hypothetical protein
MRRLEKHQGYLLGWQALANCWTGQMVRLYFLKQKTRTDLLPNQNNPLTRELEQLK